MGQGGLQPGGEQGGPDLGCRPQLQALTPAGWVPATPPLGPDWAPSPLGHLHSLLFALLHSLLFHALQMPPACFGLLWAFNP